MLEVVEGIYSAASQLKQCSVRRDTSQTNDINVSCKQYFTVL